MSTGPVIFASTTATTAADDGISPSTVQSAQLRQPLMVWSPCSMELEERSPRHIEGVCEKLRKGTLRVGFWVGNCAGYGSANAFTGWNSVSRIYVEEIPPPQA